MSSKKIWDFWAKRYENLWVQKYSLGPTRREIIKYLIRGLNKGREYKILDIGCGTGQLLRDMKKNLDGHSIKLYGIDFSEEMIEEGKKRDGSINFSILNVNSLGTMEERFDVITCTHSFPYYENQKEVLSDMRKLLKKDGCLFLAQASQNNLYDSFAMFFVKFTTGKAKYPSVKEISKLAEGIFVCEELIKIKEKFYMPSIYFFVMRGI